MSYKGIYVTVTHIFMIKVKVVRLVIYDFRLNKSNKLIREKSTTFFLQVNQKDPRALIESPSHRVN